MIDPLGVARCGCNLSKRKDPPGGGPFWHGSLLEFWPLCEVRCVTPAVDMTGIKLPSHFGQNELKWLAMRMRVAILAAMMLVIDATKIRLERIDAPETDQVCLNAKAIRWNCGIDARDQLAAHLAGQEIKCTSSGVDAKRGTLAKCYLAGEDLNGWMVQQGWALPYFRALVHIRGR